MSSPRTAHMTKRLSASLTNLNQHVTSPALLLHIQLHMPLSQRLFRNHIQLNTPILKQNSCRSIVNMAQNSLKRTSTTQDKTVSPPPTKRKLTTTTTNKAVANFFKPASEKEREVEKTTFRVLHETLLNARYDNPTNAGSGDPPTSSSRSKPVKIAAFDFDDTLITTKSGLKFARGEDDWKWWHPSVPSKLKQLHAEGYALVILSNQAAVNLKSDPKMPNGGMRSLNNLRAKANAVFKALDLPVSLYAATEKDTFRKPRTGMWKQLLSDYGVSGDETGEVDLEGSVFVGDAAGRDADPKAGRKKDHSCSDRDFATNVGIGFSTPEEFFLGEEVKPFTRTFEPAKYLDAEVMVQTDSTPIVFSKKNELELVLFCGSPGAGKSTFYWTHLQRLGYERVNQDLLKTRDKCMRVATQFLEDKVSVAVDNTNADIETRAAWISLAKKMKVPVRLVHFTASARLCEHNDTVRALTAGLVSPLCNLFSLHYLNLLPLPRGIITVAISGDGSSMGCCFLHFANLDAGHVCGRTHTHIHIPYRTEAETDTMEC